MSVNQIDVNAVNAKKKTVRLCDIQRGSKIMCDCSDGSTYIIFNNLDGMYSHCTTENGETVHLGVMQPLLVMAEGVYKI